MSLYFYIINESMPKPAAMKTEAKKKKKAGRSCSS